MVLASVHYYQFVKEICRTKVLWSIKDAGGFPAPRDAHGKRVMPFWSTLELANAIIARNRAYAAFKPARMALEEFTEEWLPTLQEDGIGVGVNWAGAKAHGFDIDPGTLLASIRKHLMAPP
jgi:hypothetical protein